MMKERGIIMSGDNPRLILEGRKTQTRRIVKNDDWHGCLTGDCAHAKQIQCDVYMATQCPYGVAGDRLWVRETFWMKDGNMIRYRADNLHWKDVEWTPSIHMPRYQSRITLEILKVRVERLQDISEEDARAEGVNPSPIFEGDTFAYRTTYSTLWDTLHHGKGAWDLNPWVWVLEFRKA